MLNDVGPLLVNCEVKYVHVFIKSEEFELFYWYLQLIECLDIIVGDSKDQSFSACEVF